MYGTLRNLGAAVAGAIAKRPRTFAPSLTINANRGNNTGVTSQYDKARQYTFKRAPKKIRRKYKRIAKNARWALIKTLGTRTQIRNHEVGNSWTAGAWTTSSSQRVSAVALYGLNGTTPTAQHAGYTDVAAVSTNDPDFDEKSEAILFSGAVLDLTFRNTSASMGLEVDMYEIIFKGTSSAGNIILDYNNAIGDTTKQAGALVGPVTLGSLDSRGITPFDVSLASSRGYKILKKTKYFVPAGQTFTFQHRDPRNHYISAQTVLNENNGQWRWQTYNLLFVAKPLVGTSTSTAGSFSIGATRSYKYKVLKDNKDYGQIVSA